MKTSVAVITHMRVRLNGSSLSKNVGSKAEKNIHAFGFETLTMRPFINICFLLGKFETFVMLSSPLPKKEHRAKIEHIKACDDI